MKRNLEISEHLYGTLEIIRDTCLMSGFSRLLADAAKNVADKWASIYVNEAFLTAGSDLLPANPTARRVKVDLELSSDVEERLSICPAADLILRTGLSKMLDEQLVKALKDLIESGIRAAYPELCREDPAPLRENDFY
jgi:hypothetical protein